MKKRRFFACSDLHVSRKENWESLKDIVKKQDYSNDVVLIAGDISHNLFDLKKTFKLFSDFFHKVFYCPGNHCLWLLGEDEKNFKTSIEKWEEIKKVCREYGIIYEQYKFKDSNVWVLPILSWYDFEFDSVIVDSKTEKKLLEEVSDSILCKFEDLNGNVISEIRTFRKGISELLINMNKIDYNQVEDTDFVISFSHFLPRRELLPSRDALRYPNLLPKVCGSRSIERIIRKVNSKIHIFGHSHIDDETLIDGVRYLANSFGYPKEKARRSFSRKRKDYFTTPFLEIDEKGKKIQYLMSEKSEVVWFNELKNIIKKSLNKSRLKS